MHNHMPNSIKHHLDHNYDRSSYSQISPLTSGNRPIGIHVGNYLFPSPSMAAQKVSPPLPSYYWSLQIFYYYLYGCTKQHRCPIFQKSILLILEDMSEMEGIKKIREKRNNQQNKRRPRQKKQKPLVRKIGAYQVDFDTSLGKGQFGNVYQAWKIDQPEELYACKHISEKRLSSEDAYDQNLIGKTLKDRLMDQIKTHQSLGDCEYIVKLIEFEVQKDGHFLFMEMCETDLGKRIKSVGTLDEPQAMNFFKQLLRGYRHLYDKKISHRDLKPENLLLKNQQIKIADFGFVKMGEDIDMITKSQQKSQFMAESVVGTINYIAPDVLRADTKGTKYNPFKSDVWSMGIILYKMLYGRQPYRASSKAQLLQQIDTKPLQFPQQKKVSQGVKNLLSKMIQKSEKQRLGFKEVYEKTFQNSQQKQLSKTLKQSQLQFYNQLMIKISYDSANYATFRQIGIEQYQQFSSQLMTLIHERRQQVLEKNVDLDVDQTIKNQIAYYSNTFYYAIKETSKIKKGADPDKLILKLLTTFHDKLIKYQEFSYLHASVQYFLLLLLQLYRFQRKQVTIGFIKTMIDKEKASKMTLASLQKIRKTSLITNQQPK